MLSFLEINKMTLIWKIYRHPLSLFVFKVKIDNKIFKINHNNSKQKIDLTCNQEWAGLEEFKLWWGVLGSGVGCRVGL